MLITFISKACKNKIKYYKNGENIQIAKAVVSITNLIYTKKKML